MSRVLPQHLPELSLIGSSCFVLLFLPGAAAAAAAAPAAAAAVGREAWELDYVVGRAGGTEHTDIDRFKRSTEDTTTTLFSSGCTAAAVGVACDAVLVPSFLLFLDGKIGVIHRETPGGGQLLLLQGGEDAREVVHVVHAPGLLVVFAGGVGETDQGVGPEGREGGGLNMSVGA